MIDYEFQNLFLEQDVEKQIVIEYDTGTITNNEIHQEAFSVEESICSEENLVFGSCESSVLEFTVSNVFEELKGKQFDVSMVLAGNTSNPFEFGKFKVYSDVPTADRKQRTVTAYDALYDIINADVLEWYKALTSRITLKQFRNSFFAYFGIEQEEVSLANDDLQIFINSSIEELSGKTVVNSICEINGCFGHIGRNGKFRYVFLPTVTEGLYPSQTLYPSETLFPREANTKLIKTGTYIPPCAYENYMVEKISGIYIFNDSWEGKHGTEENPYTVSSNLLTYGKNGTELSAIAEKMFNVVKGIQYRPFNTKAKGNLCLEVGDSVRLSTSTQKIESYILQRKISGIQELRDEYTAEGEQYQPNNLNSIRQQIQSLQRTTSEIGKRIDGEITVRLEELDESIIAEVKRASDVEGNLSSRIEVALTGISIEMEDESGLTTGIKITMTKENGEESEVSGNINIKGFVTFEDLKGEGTTTINGANIKTGKISAEYIDLSTITELPSLTVNSMLVKSYMEVTSEDSSAYLVADNLSVYGLASVGGTLTTDSLKVTFPAITVGNFEATWQSADVLDADGKVITIEYLGFIAVG